MISSGVDAPAFRSSVCSEKMPAPRQSEDFAATARSEASARRSRSSSAHLARCELCVEDAIASRKSDARRSLPRAESRRGSRTDRIPPVTLAAMQGRLDHVRHWIEHAGCDVDTLDFVGTTPLHRAALEGHADVVSYLIRRGALLQTRVLDAKDTVLHLAAAKGHAEVVRRLLSGGAHIEARNADNSTALLAAVRANHLRVVQVLVANGASPSAPWPLDEFDVGTALHLAAQYGHLALVKFFVCVVAIDVNQRTRCGRATPLHFAARHGHVELVRYLLDLKQQRVDVNARDARGMTPLHHACDYDYHLEMPLTQCETIEHRHIEIVTTLLASGAEVKARRHRDQATSLRCAAMRGHLQVAKTLLDHGARSSAATKLLFALFWARGPLKIKYLLSDSKRRDPTGSASAPSEVDMNLAKDRGNDPSRDSLSSCGTQPESPAGMTGPYPSRRTSSSSLPRRSCSGTRRSSVRDGRTSLHSACRDSDLMTLLELLDPTSNDDELLEARSHPDGMTALHIATQNGWTRGVAALLRAGADVDVETTADGSTPLHLAAERGHLATLKQLVAHGAAPEACDHSGATPLMVALRSGRSRALKHLLRHGGAASLSQSQSQCGHDDYRSSYIDLGALASFNEDPHSESDEATAPAFDPECTTALHLAAFDGVIERVRQLVWDGEDVDARDQDGATPLWLAALMGRLDVVAFLAEQGANVNAVANDGASVALGAAEFGHLEVLTFLTGDPTPRLDWERRSLTRLSLQDHASVSRTSVSRRLSA